jgi:hypothetical protein
VLQVTKIEATEGKEPIRSLSQNVSEWMHNKEGGPQTEATSTVKGTPLANGSVTDRREPTGIVAERGVQGPQLGWRGKQVLWCREVVPASDSDHHKNPGFVRGYDEVHELGGAQDSLTFIRCLHSAL